MSDLFSFDHKVPNVISVLVLIWGFLFSILVFVLYKAETNAQDLELLFNPYPVATVEFDN